MHNIYYLTSFSFRFLYLCFSHALSKHPWRESNQYAILNFIVLRVATSDQLLENSLSDRESCYGRIVTQRIFLLKKINQSSVQNKSDFNFTCDINLLKVGERSKFLIMSRIIFHR